MPPAPPAPPAAQDHHPTTPSRRPRGIAALTLLSLTLGLTTSLASILLLALLLDPPNTPPTVLRSFIREQRAWSLAESHRFGISRAWWSQLTRSSMTAPADKSPLVRARELLGLAAPEAEDPAQLIADLHRSSGPTILSRPGGRILEEPAAWGQFATGEPLPGQSDLGCDVGYGWPLTAAWYQVRGRSRGNLAYTDKLRHAHLISGTPAARGDLTCRVIPLRPVWPALAANTVFFSFAWLLAILTLSTARRALRRRRNLCPHCAYDLRATPAASPCPECGRLPA
jgi:hypothetical protein